MGPMNNVPVLEKLIAYRPEDNRLRLELAEIYEADGDLFGTCVNTAARVCDLAECREVLEPRRSSEGWSRAQTYDSKTTARSSCAASAR
jgi:hypothetical protein